VNTEDFNMQILRSQKNADTLPLTQQQRDNPKENLSIPYLQCTFKLGSHAAERVYYQLLKEQRRSESPSNLADTIRRYLSEELYKPKGTYGK